MVEKADPAVLRHVVVFLRHLTGMNQAAFGKACRVDQANLSRFEGGKTAPPIETLRRMAAAARVPWSTVVHLVRFHTALLATTGREATSDASIDVDRIILGSIDLAVSPHLVEEIAENEEDSTEKSRQRREADEIVAALECLEPAVWRRLLHLSFRASQSWAVAERLSHASARAAAHNVENALALAELALEVARKIPDEAERARTEGYCTGFYASVQRVATEFERANAAVSLSWELWRAGEAAAWLPLAESRLLDLESSLQREQRRFPEALECLDRALRLCGGQTTATARILLKKEHVFEAMGDVQGALAALREATPLVEASGDPHLLFALRFKVVNNLCHLGCYADAAAQLPVVQAAALEQGDELNLIRVVWLGSKVAAGQGRIEEAKADLEQVREDFTARALPYEAALSSLDLALLLLREGRTAEVRELAIAMSWIFEARGITREALMSLSLFLEAARQERATIEMARQVITEVERVRPGTASSLLPSRHLPTKQEP